MSRASLMILALFAVTSSPAAGQGRPDDVRFRSGNIVVKEQTRHVRIDDRDVRVKCHVLLRDGIDFGVCHDDPKLRLLGTTYYHPQGPVGLAFAKLASKSAEPPPVGVIGMNAGTAAVYARARQQFHFFEANKQIIALNERKDKNVFFHYIPDARGRGAKVEIFHGAPRQQLREQIQAKFYHLMILEACSGENGEKIYLDLFTKEAIAECFEKIADNGVLCVHTSHRFLDLPPVLATIGKELKLHVRRGHDSAPGNSRRSGFETLSELAHYTSEWVLLSRSEKVLADICKAPTGYEEMIKKANREDKRALDLEYWTTPTPSKHLWTDKGPNLLHGVLRGHPSVMRYQATATTFVEHFAPILEVVGVHQHELYPLTMVPRPIEQGLVEMQLKTNPRVDQLWP